MVKKLSNLFALIAIIALGITIWFFYPQYQIYKLKKQTTVASSTVHQISYFNYFRESNLPEISHLAIGDSVIRGVGASQNEDLVYQFSEKFSAKTHKKILFQNEGISGITSGQLNELVKQGKFDDEFKKANIITINVGGNDVLKMVKQQNFQNVFQSFDQLQSNYTANLSDIAARINKMNPKATIVFLELYNPLNPNDKLYKIADQLLPKWNVNIYKVAHQYSSSIVIETTKVINGEHLQYLSSDGVHPNNQGYAAITNQMIYQFQHQYRRNNGNGSGSKRAA